MKYILILLSIYNCIQSIHAFDKEKQKNELLKNFAFQEEHSRFLAKLEEHIKTINNEYQLTKEINLARLIHAILWQNSLSNEIKNSLNNVIIPLYIANAAWNNIKSYITDSNNTLLKNYIENILQSDVSIVQQLLFNFNYQELYISLLSLDIKNDAQNITIAYDKKINEYEKIKKHIIDILFAIKNNESSFAIEKGGRALDLNIFKNIFIKTLQILSNKY